MASITPILAFQDTEQTTDSTTPVTANCTTSVLANGVDYLVIYRGNVGAGALSERSMLELVWGTNPIGDTVLASCGGEGRGLDKHWDSNQTQGFCRITGDGSKKLGFQFYNLLSECLGAVGSMAIIAIPLTELTENTDYWYSGTNSATLELEDATEGGWDILRTETWSLPELGDYLILMSAECQPGDSGDSACGYLCRFRVAGATVGSEYRQEWKDNIDWMSCQIAHLKNLSAGSNIFAIEVGSVGYEMANFRRSRIWVFKKSAFDQIVQTIDTTGESTTSTSYEDFDGLNTTYTPNQQEYVIILTHTVGGFSIPDSCVMQLRNNTDANDFNVDSGEFENDNGFDSERDQQPTLLAYTEQISSAKNYRAQYRAVAGGTAAIGRNPDNSGGIPSYLIIWSLTTAEAPEGDIEEVMSTAFDNIDEVMGVAKASIDEVMGVSS